MAFRNELLLEWQKREFITTGSMAARIIGISPAFYLDILNGRKKPGIGKLEKIRAKTGYSVAELLGQEE